MCKGKLIEATGPTGRIAVRAQGATKAAFSMFVCLKDIADF